MPRIGPVAPEEPVPPPHVWRTHLARLHSDHQEDLGGTCCCLVLAELMPVGKTFALLESQAMSQTLSEMGIDG